MQGKLFGDLPRRRQPRSDRPVTTESWCGGHRARSASLTSFECSHRPCGLELLPWTSVACRSEVRSWSLERPSCRSEIHASYETKRREATEELLNLVAAAMRSVIIPTEDYKTLQQIFMVRRLWVKEGSKLSPSKAMDLNRRFAVGVHRILRLAERAKGAASVLTSNELEQDQDSENQEPLKEAELQEFEELRAELEVYMQTLKRLGIRDHQVPQLVWWTMGDLMGRFMYLLVTLALGVIPNLMFNFPIMIVASRFAVAEQKKSLKSSSVKLAARDVVTWMV
ncbi:unnamed protein product [Durusdinium trenchii]|uniref:Uncharacterized protein n=2 Tax=Durusdinium trenchii TaxID=1381693 RepID=A0ABP0QP50_9DINO